MPDDAPDPNRDDRSANGRPPRPAGRHRSPWTPPNIQWHLQPHHQGWVAVILGCGLLLLIARWSYLAWQADGLIDIDQAPGIVVPFQIDVNHAQWFEFAVLPGIGETLARRIVDDRERNGRFQSNAELGRVPGVGPRSLERLAPFLTPRPALAPPAPTPLADDPHGTN